MTPNTMMIDPVLFNDWHPVVRCDALYEGKLLAARLLDHDLVLWRSGGEVRVWRDRCPHRGTRLSLGEIRNGEALVCPYHGWHFDAAGRCILMPAQPDQRPSKKACATVYQAAERHDLVWVCLGEPARDVPDLGGVDDSYRLVITGPYDVETSGPRAIENFLDMAHFAFVHTGLLGEEPHTEIKDYEVAATDGGIVVTNCRAWQPRSSSVSAGGAEVAYTYEITRPLSATLSKETGAAGDKPEEFISMVVTPVSETRIRAWTLMAMTYAHGQPERKFIDFQDTIFFQDKDILESQRPRRLPLDPAAEFHQRADRASLAYRKWLRDMGLTYGTIP